MSSTASAAYLYDNGPANGSYSAFNIGDDSLAQSTTDSFVLSTSALVTSVDFVAWTGGTGVSSLDWAITTSPFGSIVASDTATTSSILNDALTAANDSFNVYDVSFDTGGVNLVAGTYWLQLSGAEQTGVDPGSASVFWDENDGPSQAFAEPPLASLANYTCGYDCGQSGSETFQLEGTATPEPGTVTMLLSGLLLLGAARYKAMLRLLPQTARLQPRN